MKPIPYHWVYILECRNNSYNTGYTNNILRRYYEHKKGTSKCVYTGSFGPCRMVQCWRLFEESGIAKRVEYFIKKLPRQKKINLVWSPSLLKKYISDQRGLKVRIYLFPVEIIESLMEFYDHASHNRGPDRLISLPRRDMVQPLSQSALNKTLKWYDQS